MIFGDGNECGIYIGNSKNVNLKNNKVLNCINECIYHSVKNMLND